MIHDFVEALRLEPTSPTAFRGELYADWYQGRGAYGGLQAALLARAAKRVAGPERTLRTLAINFTAPATEGPCIIEIERVQEGRNISQLALRLRRGAGPPLAAGFATLGRSRRSAITIDDSHKLDSALRAPALAKPEEVPEGPDSLYLPTFASHIELRLGVGHAPFSGATSAHIGGWCRMKQADPNVNSETMCALIDAWPPAALCLAREWMAAASIDMTLHFFEFSAELPSSLPLAFEARCTRASSGYAEDSSALWSADGTLLVAARQHVALFG